MAHPNIAVVQAGEITVRYDMPALYAVYMFGEVGQVTNLIRALAYYRQVAGECWPRDIVVHSHNRLSIGLGDATLVDRITHAGVPMLLDAVYMGLYNPYSTPHHNKRTSVVLPFKERTIVMYSGSIMRSREERSYG